MPDAAIVIGVDRYWKPEACLKGAVRDALQVRAWLIDHAKVPEDNVFLLLAPLEGQAVAVPFVDATCDNILRTIQKTLPDKVGREGKRFFFHFSGHGVNARINLADVNALLATDFDEELTQKSLAYSSLLQYFQATQFEEQFFFFDACRNAPPLGEFDVGRIARPGKIDPNLPPVQQYVCYATSPGLKAIELQHAGDERGAFTSALLDGLAGTGRAKSWDAENGQYLVRWDELFRYVETAVKAQRLAVEAATKDIDDGAPSPPPTIQLPRKAGEHGGQNPVVARLAAERVPASHLRVELAPATFGAVVELIDFGEFEDAVPADDAVLELHLPPREYRVSAHAPNRLAAKGKRVDLYDASQTVQLALVAGPAQTRAAGLESLGPKPMGRLSVVAADPVARVEIVDRTGAVMASALGQIAPMLLKPGIYTARSRTPEGEYVEEAVDLDPRAVEQVTLGGPTMPSSRVARQLVSDGVIEEHADHTLAVTEADPHVASARLSTLLTLAAHAVNQGVHSGSRLYDLGLRSATSFMTEESTAGIQLLVGLERGTPEQAGARGAESRVTLRGGPPRSLCMFPQIRGLGAVAEASAAGPCAIEIAIADREPFVIETVVVEGRLTLLVVHEAEDGELLLYQYLPRLRPEAASPSTSIRALELAQRAFQRGDFAAARDFAERALTDDAVARLLLAYVHLKLGALEPLGALLPSLLIEFGAVPDVHVLAGERGDLAAYGRAAARGTPIFAEGARRLADALPDIQTAHHALLDFIWTVQSAATGARAK